MRREELEELIHPILAEEGYELVDCAVARGHRTQTFRIFIDRGGVLTVEECGHVCRLICRVLDTNPLLRGAYNIEVSSPGMNRPVRTVEHLHRFQGEPVRVELAAPGEGPRILQGEIGPVEGAGFWIALPDGNRRYLRLSEIQSARLQLDPWKRRPAGEGLRKEPDVHHS